MQSQGFTLLVTCVLFVVLDTVFVGLRYYARRHLKSMPFAFEDLLVLLAWLTHVGVCVVVITLVYDVGIGRIGIVSIWNDPVRHVAWSKSLYALQMLYFSAVALPKISIYLLYLSIFDTQPARLATHLVLWTLAVNWVVWIIVTLLQCRPFAYQWNKSIPGGRCVSLVAIYKASSAPNIATDVAILIFPIRMSLQLHMSWFRKLCVLFVFWTASIGIVASCIRMVCFFKNDRSFMGRIDTYLWTVIEPGMYLAAVCFVRFRPITALVMENMHMKNICGLRSTRVSGV